MKNEKWKMENLRFGVLRFPFFIFYFSLFLCLCGKSNKIKNRFHRQKQNGKKKNSFQPQVI